MTSSTVLPQFAVFDFQYFELFTLCVDSDALKQNPLGDPLVRRMPMMIPKGASPAGGWPVVLMLSGFTGNGPQTFNIKTFQIPTPELLDQAASRGEAPRAIYVFCDAMTAWGGSQFIDSLGAGRYGTFISNEVPQALMASGLFLVSRDPNRWCVMGGSSGGYGALQLASKAPEKFGWVVALAPDSFFEASLLPEIRTALPFIRRMGGVAGVRAELTNGKLMKRKESHVILNAVAMALCYAPLKDGEPVWPIDAETGKVISEVWSEWTRHDPLEFLRARIANVLKINGFYLDAGDRDQFQLQYGTRQIRDLLRSVGANVHYNGFEGTHFDLGERRAPAWSWLATQWR